MSESTGDMTSAVEAAFAASSTPEPAPTTTTETSSASTTETPVEDVSQAATTSSETPQSQKPGPVEYPRFYEINEKYKAASKELESYGWAKGVDPKLAQSAIQLLTRAQGNPLAFTEELETLRDHPQFGPQLRSWAARTLGFRNQPRQDAPVEDVMPEPDLIFEDGRKAYSAEALAKRDQFLQRQWDAKIDEKISPLATKHAATEKYVADQVMDSIRTKATADAKTDIDTLSQQYPQFNEHKQEVADVMEANPTFTLKQAWAQVFIDKVGPKLAGQQAATVKQKVQAGSANPARPSGATKTVPEGFKAHLEQLLTGSQ